MQLILCLNVLSTAYLVLTLVGGLSAILTNAAERALYVRRLCKHTFPTIPGPINSERSSG